MNELLEKLRKYGADVDGAMERFMDDSELYQQCLDMFCEDEGFSGLGTAIAQADYHAAFEYAHTLKGVAGNLGLTPLFRAICNIVEPLRVNDYEHIEQLYEDVAQAKIEFCELLQ